MADVDRPDMRVYRVENTATIRSSRRSLINTVAIGLDSLEDVLDKFGKGEVDAVALGRESIQSLLPQLPGARMLDGRFHATGTAIAVPRGNGFALGVLSDVQETARFGAFSMPMG